jgi:hypothetical protein
VVNKEENEADEAGGGGEDGDGTHTVEAELPAQGEATTTEEAATTTEGEALTRQGQGGGEAQTWERRGEQAWGEVKTQERIRQERPFPDRRPVETPVKSTHSSPPTRRPFPTPEKYERVISKNENGHTITDRSFPSFDDDDDDEEFGEEGDTSIPSRMPVSTPCRSPAVVDVRSSLDQPAKAKLLSGKPTTPCELKYLNNTWTLTPVKDPSTELNSYPSTPPTSSPSTSMRRRPQRVGEARIQITFRCYTQDSEMSAALPLSNLTDDDVEFKIESSNEDMWKVEKRNVMVKRGNTEEVRNGLGQKKEGEETETTENLPRLEHKK